MSNDSITVLITDMEGSTAFTEGRGDSAAMDLIRTHERLVRDVVASHEGREIKSMGDGFMLAFASPEVAIACALDLQQSLRSHNESHPDEPIFVRMGINTGPVIEEGGDIYGTTVNATSRIAAKARSGQVLVADSVRVGAGQSSDWNYIDRGLYWLKGLRERWTLYEVTRGAGLAQPAVATGRSPFINRENERSSLRVHVDAALDGRGSFVLLAGDAGSGKTRLSEEVGIEASGRGMRFLVGRCYEASQKLPFAPIVEILEAVERAVSPERFRMILGEAAGEISRLIPHVRVRYPDIPPITDLPDPDQARRYLLSSIRDILANLAHERPLYLLLDDLHWADESTLLFLELLAGELETLPILLIGTYIPAELGATRRLQTAIENLHRRRLVERFHIGPLTPEDLGVLLEALAGKPPPRPLIDLLYGETEGNVFFAEEVVRHLLEQGRVLDDNGEWRPELSDLDLEVPDTIRLTIGRRLESLPEPTRKVLTIAALVGRAFGFDLLEELSDMAEEDLIDALDEAERARVIVSTSEGGAVQFRFDHELIRQTLVGAVSLTRRQMLHRRIADAIESVFAPSLREHAASIAYHLEEAGRRAEPARTHQYLVMAGERALETAAYDEAQRHLDRALILPPSDDPAIRSPILKRLGFAQRALGHREEAIGTWQEALDACDATGDAQAVAALCLDVGLQMLWWRRARDVTDLVDHGLTALAGITSPVEGGLLALSGTAASQSGNYEVANDLLDRALRIAQEHSDDRILGLALHSRAVHHFNYSEFRQALERGTESIEHLRRTSDLWTLAEALGYVSASANWLGDYTRSLQTGTEAERLGRRLGNWPAWVFGQRAVFNNEFKTNPSPTTYELDGREALELGRQQGFDWLCALGHTRMGLASFWFGRWDEAVARFEEAVRLNVRGSTSGYEAPLFLTLAYIGDRKRTLDMIERRRDEFAQPGRANTTSAWNTTLSALEAYVMLGERDQAASLFPLITELLEKGVVARGLDYRLLDTLAGVSAMCAGEWESSETHFENALRRAQSDRIKIEEADACRFYARMLSDRGAPGDARRARELLVRATDAFNKMSMVRHEELARDLLRQIA